MPNAASLDADFAHRAPGRRKPAQASARKKGRKPSLARRVAMLDSVPRYGAIAISALIGVGIVVNALMMQHGSHPAPLFGGAVPAKPAPAQPVTAKLLPTKLLPTKPAPTKAAQRPEAAMAEVGAAPAGATVTAPVTAAVAAPAMPDAAVHGAAHPSKAARGDDPIARLIGGGSAGTAPHRAKVAERTSPARPGKAAAEKHRKGDE